MKKWLLAILVLSLVIFPGFGCGDDEGITDEVQPVNTGNNQKAIWTVFVYGIGDNNLTNSLLEDLDKMAQATLSPDVRIVAAADWNASYEIEYSGQKYPTGTEWYLIEGNGSSKLLSTDKERNSDEPANLTSAIAHAYKMFPAQRYGLILWDHGGSWDGGFGGDEQDGKLENPRFMTALEISDAVKSGLKEANISGDRPLEFLAFDTCLMGNAEVAYILRDLSKAYIANAEIDYGSGWNYTEVFSNLASNPNMSAVEFAKMETSTWDNLHKAVTSSDVFLRSHIALDTQKIDDFAAATGEFVGEILKAEEKGGDLFQYEEELARAASMTLPSYRMDVATKAGSPRYRDFGEFLEDIERQNQLGDIAVKAGLAKTALKTMIIGNDYGDLRSHQYGLSVALPEITDIDQAMLNEYGKKAAPWSDKTGWGKLLAEFAADVPDRGPDVEHVLENGNQPGASGTSSITFSTPTSSACTVSLELIGPNPTAADHKAYYGTVVSGVIRSDQTYTLSWTDQSWTVGTRKQRATVVPWVVTETDINNANSMPSLLGVYGHIKTVDGELSADTVLLFRGDQDYADTVAFETANGSWAAAPLQDLVDDFPDAMFTPALLEWDPVSDSASLVFAEYDEILPADGRFPVQAAPVPAGDYTLVTICTDVWGMQTVVTDEVKIKAP